MAAAAMMMMKDEKTVRGRNNRKRQRSPENEHGYHANKRNDHYSRTAASFELAAAQPHNMSNHSSSSSSYYSADSNGILFARDQLLRGCSGASSCFTCDDGLLGLDLARSSSFEVGDDTYGENLAWLESAGQLNQRGGVIPATATARDSSLMLDNMLVHLGENVPYEARETSGPSPVQLIARASSTASCSSSASASSSSVPLDEDAIYNMFAGYR